MLYSRNRIGEFDRTITFQQKVIQANDYNADDIADWENIAIDPEVPAKKVEKFGNEYYEADKLNEVRETIFTIRYREDVSELLRIVDDNGYIYDILSIVETSRRRYQDIRVESRNEKLEINGGGFSSGYSDGYDNL